MLDRGGHPGDSEPNIALRNLPYFAHCNCLVRIMYMVGPESVTPSPLVVLRCLPDLDQKKIMTKLAAILDQIDSASDDVAVPAHDRVRSDQQPQPLTSRFRYHAEQGREQCPVRPGQVRDHMQLASAKVSDP